jgi:hypothetical protein
MDIIESNQLSGTGAACCFCFPDLLLRVYDSVAALLMKAKVWLSRTASRDRSMQAVLRVASDTQHTHTAEYARSTLIHTAELKSLALRLETPADQHLAGLNRC